MVETVFKTIKSELIWRTTFATRNEARKSIGQYIEGFYNPRRRHSSLGYMSPASEPEAASIRNQGAILPGRVTLNMSLTRRPRPVDLSEADG